MNLKRTLRITVMLMLLGLLALVLASCKLPASKGPQTGQSGEEFPSRVRPSKPARSTWEPWPHRPPRRDLARWYLLNLRSKHKLPPNLLSILYRLIFRSFQPSQLPLPPHRVCPTHPGSIPATYTLQDGEYVFCIARRFDVNVSELLELNNLAPDTLVGPGLELQIPQTGDPFEGERRKQDHPTPTRFKTGIRLARSPAPSVTSLPS